MKYLSYTLLILIAIVVSCDKDVSDLEDARDYPDFEFIELKATSDTIRGGFESTDITAVARGAELQYLWSATGGSISSSGRTVQFHTTVCTFGQIIITCKVEDKRGYSDVKSIMIVVVN